MKHVLTIIFSVVSGIYTAYCTNDNYPFGGRAAGMGNAAVTLYDPWAVSHNQAGLAQMENSAAGVYFENRFLVQELSLGAGAFILPTHSGVFGASFTYFGFELYNESKVGLAYARGFGERFSAGIQLNYHNTYIAEDYGNKGALTVEMGAIYHIVKGLSIGAHIFNPTRAKIAEFADERIPTIFRTGLSYEFSQKVMVVVETEKSINHDPVFKFGIEYHITEPFYIRGGIGTNPTSNSFGFGLELGKLKVDLASSFHHVLGYSPQVSFLYEMR